MHSVCVVESHVTVNYKTIWSVAQKYFYGKLMWPLQINVRRSSRKVPDAALKQKTFRLLMAFFQRSFSVFVLP
jgi:hypothetical protein